MASERVTWIGLGNIGRGMSRNIALKGPQTTPLALYNRTTSKATALAESLGVEKATAVSSLPTAVKDATIVFICVGDDHALDQIIDALINDASVNLADKIFVDCSTVHPDTSRRIHKTLAAQSAAYIACPVFGAPNMADAGKLLVVPAGAAAAVERIRPFLDGVVAIATMPVGDDSDVGRATLLKVLGNTFILNTVETLAEGMVAAEKSGLGIEVYQKFINIAFPGPFAKYADRMAGGDYYQREEPLFAVDLARKDLRHAASLGQDAGMRMRSVEVTDGYLKEVKAERGEKGDIAGVYGAIRKESGLPYERK
ncbi:oxidoreductase [Aspergillus campestris IBT 28561]|uniref:Oxidoreductase n=1 Tax=Aspergillus campestris (strain IBT 28561) TaxID=1392248 RepID=A0A2I1CUX2_ASPC2|nr:oxidoreductase [Aspergillus campestris IBT 28561]PKY01430.1 oxidoreductase [Aspergillus campestris IBT 28561]